MKLSMTAFAILLSSVVNANAGDGWRLFGLTIPYHNDACRKDPPNPFYKDYCKPKDDGRNGNSPDDNSGNSVDDSNNTVTNPGNPGGNNGGNTNDSNGGDSSSDSNGDNSDGDNGHGNDDDRDDDSNPGKGRK